MRHQWLIVHAKNTWENFDDIFVHTLVDRLGWKPEQVEINKIGHFSICVSFSSNASIFGYRSPTFKDDNNCCMVSGLPTLEEYNCPPNCNIPQAINELVNATEYEDLFHKLGGNWAFGRSSKNKISVLSNFSGYSSCFYGNSEEYFVTGNKASLVASFFGKGKNYNYKALSWLFSTTMILGEETAFEHVKKIPVGSSLSYSEDLGLQISPLETNFFTPLKLNNDEKDDYLKDRISCLNKRTAWYIKRGIPLSTHLTGGKDSRVILSLLQGSGAFEDISAVLTTGSPDNGDVIVAKLIAEKLDFTNKHRVTPGNKKAIENPKQLLDLPSIAKGFYHTAFKYDAQLTPFDGLGKAIGNFPNKVAFMGGGGEIYRQKEYLNHKNITEIFEQFISWSYPYNTLNILTKDAVNSQHAFIKQEARSLHENNILNHQAKYYIDHRLSNWGCGHMQNGSCNTIPLLLDIGLCRLMFSENDMGENIHFDIIRHSCPELLKIPLLNSGWYGPTRDRAKSFNLDIVPIKVNVDKNFPWQFALYENFRDGLVNIALDNYSDNYSDYISIQQIENIKNTPLTSGSARIKMLTGLVMCLLYYNEEENFSDPDCLGLKETHFSGNYLNIRIIEAIEKKHSNINDNSDISRIVSTLENVNN